MTIFASPAHSAGGYQIDKSLRFRASASAYLSRTPASAGSLTTWTWSGWVKRGALGVLQYLFSSGTSSIFSVSFQADDTLRIRGTTVEYITTAKYRDPSAHMHICVTWDTTNGTAGDRVRLYVNGVEVTAFTTETHAGASEASEWNKAQSNQIGRHAFTAGSYIDGYLSEINFIDGQALDPSYFGQTNSDGVWVPKKYTGTYGANGFYLDFKDGTSLTTLGYDAAGSNDWTLNNISLTAGVTYDWMVDTPTNNYAVLNAVVPASGGTRADGNLTITTTATNNVSPASIQSSSLLQYAEVYLTTKGAPAFGVYDPAVSAAQNPGTPPASFWHLYDTGANLVRCNNGATTAAAAAAAANTDIWQVAFNPVTGNCWVGRNNAWYDSSLGTTGNPSSGANPTFSGLSSSLVIFFGNGNAASTMNANFGQRPFTYTPPTGFKALCTANLPVVTIQNPKKHFDVKTRAGDSNATQTTTGIQFAPEFVWTKIRNGTLSHVLFDVIRGTGKDLNSNSAGAENTNNADGYLSAFTTDGYTMTNGTTSGNLVKGNTYTYVDWLWKANGAGVSNTAGTITSTVSANTTAGFSIVTYTGTGANATVGHGLGVAPKMIFTKSRSGLFDWGVYHASAGATKAGNLNLTDAFAISSTYWQDTAPSSTVFSVGSANQMNDASDTYVAYCYAEIPGYSKFGSYTGNGSTDGPFVYCGFRPRFVLTKRIDVADDWNILDTARSTYNEADAVLFANVANVEYTTSDRSRDILSNGFKCRDTDVEINANGGTYIFAAFAEHPFGGSNTSPSPAR